MQKLSGALQPLSQKSSVSKELSDIVMKALSSSPDLRYESCGAFAAALQETIEKEETHSHLKSFVDRHSPKKHEETKSAIQKELQAFLMLHPKDMALQEKAQRLERLLQRFPQEPLGEWEQRLETGRMQIDQLIRSYNNRTEENEEPVSLSHSKDSPSSSALWSPHVMRLSLLVLGTFVVAIALSALFFSWSRTPSLSGKWLSSPIQYNGMSYIYVLDIQQDKKQLNGQIQTHGCYVESNKFTEETIGFTGTIAELQNNAHTISINLKSENSDTPFPVRLIGTFEYKSWLSTEGAFSPAQLFFVSSNLPALTKHSKDGSAILHTKLKKKKSKKKVLWCLQRSD